MTALRNFSKFTLFVTTLFLFSPVAAQSIEGRVVGVSDGDTITLLTPSNQQFKVRLDGIDAPEDGQEFSSASKRALSSFIAGKTVILEIAGTDRYQRTLGTIYVGDQNVNLRMVRSGMAWHYKKYSGDRTLDAAERAAQSEGLGLWSGFRPTAPWDYRALKKRPLNSSGGHWLNSSSKVRHNSSCKWFGTTSSGRSCGPDDGNACGICGG